jgi:hypothetical protein
MIELVTAAAGAAAAGPEALGAPRGADFSAAAGCWASGEGMLRSMFPPGVLIRTRGFEQLDDPQQRPITLLVVNRRARNGCGCSAWRMVDSRTH